MKWSIVSVSLALTLIITMLVGLNWHVYAQGGDGEGNVETVDPYERFYGGGPKIEGDAEWTVGDNTFESNYPVGFNFTVKVSSTGGDIVSARVIWSHNIGNRRSRPATWDPETGIASLDHVTATGESVPGWVAINYKWSFEDASGNLYETEWFLGEEYEAHPDQWTRAESEDIIVFVEEGLPDEVADMTIDAMAAQRETYRQAWGGLLPFKPRAILFSNRTSWNEWRIGESASRVIGTTRDEWGATVQVISGGNAVDLAYGTVLHEIAHLYQGEFAGAFAIGTWWNEGNATLFELNQQYDYESRVRNLAAMGELPTMLQGLGPGQQSTGADGRNRLGYDTGYTLWKYIVENWGLDAHREIIEAWRSGASRNEALETVLGISADELETRWRLWLGASGVAETPIPTPTFSNPLLRTPNAPSSQ
jgi:hypothetical protein